jgi:hypothetical protein
MSMTCNTTKTNFVKNQLVVIQGYVKNAQNAKNTDKKIIKKQ